MNNNFVQKSIVLKKLINKIRLLGNWTEFKLGVMKLLFRPFFISIGPNHNFILRTKVLVGYYKLLGFSDVSAKNYSILDLRKHFEYFGKNSIRVRSGRLEF